MAREYIVQIHPKAKARPRFSRSGHAFTPTETKEYERDVRNLLQAQHPKKMTGPIALDVTFMYHRKGSAFDYRTSKPDIDNLVKGIMDAANGVLWDDDAQVVKLTASKLCGGCEDQILIEVDEL